MKSIVVDLTMEAIPNLSANPTDDSILFSAFERAHLAIGSRIPIFISARTLDPEIPLTVSISLLTRIDLDILLESFSLFSITIIIDGLDELPAPSRSAVEEQIQNFYKDNLNVNIIVTSRVSPNSSQFAQDAAHFKLREFSLSEIQELLSKRGNERATAYTLDFLSKPENKDLRTPLMAGLILNNAENFTDIPQHEYAIVSQTLETLFHRHDATKGSYRRRGFLNLSIDVLIRLVQMIALIMVTEDRHLFNNVDFEQVVLRASVAANLPSLDAKDVRQELLEFGVLLEFGNDVGFVHRSFIEPLAVDAAMSLASDTEIVANVILRMLGSPMFPSFSRELASRFPRSKRQALELKRQIEKASKDYYRPSDDILVILKAIDFASKNLDAADDILTTMFGRGH